MVEGWFGLCGKMVMIGMSSGAMAVCGLFSVGKRWRGSVCLSDGITGWKRCSLASSMSLVAYSGLLSEEEWASLNMAWRVHLSYPVVVFSNQMFQLVGVNLRKILVVV